MSFIAAFSCSISSYRAWPEIPRGAGGVQLATGPSVREVGEQDDISSKLIVVLHRAHETSIDNAEIATG
jgi:hypothetical protein